MRVFITGVGCVGKTTIGAKLAALLDCSFFDLDDEIEKFFSMPIELLQDKFLTIYSFREEASKALEYLLKFEDSQNSVIALPSSGLMHGYWRVIKKTTGITVVITDEAENILNRVIFFDKESKPIEKYLSDEDKKYYLREIKKDITYFNRTYKRANIFFNIAGLDADQSAVKLESAIKKFKFE